LKCAGFESAPKENPTEHSNTERSSYNYRNCFSYIWLPKVLENYGFEFFTKSCWNELQIFLTKIKKHCFLSKSGTLFIKLDHLKFIGRTKSGGKRQAISTHCALFLNDPSSSCNRALPHMSKHVTVQLLGI
jgi:hypothetical protein